jgi:Permuted papain-like amidase enzyme, YaeF/YiiX, C92 family
MSTMRDAAFVALIILLVGLSYGVKRNATFASAGKPQILPESLRSGDIIFRRGPSIESGVVMAMDRAANFSHAGIVLRERDGTFVIHVVTGEGGPDTIKVEPIHDYLRSDRAIAAIAYRVVDENPSLTSRAVESAREYVARAVPFDGDFDLASDDALYCTELVWRVYQKAGIDLVAERLDQPTTSFIKGPVLWPSVLLRSKHLKVVWEWNPREEE